MEKYYITYKSTTDGDCCTVWTMARDREDAIEQTKREYWDVGEIIEAYRA